MISDDNNNILSFVLFNTCFVFCVLWSWVFLRSWSSRYYNIVLCVWFAFFYRASRVLPVCTVSTTYVAPEGTRSPPVRRSYYVASRYNWYQQNVWCLYTYYHAVEASGAPANAREEQPAAAELNGGITEKMRTRHTKCRSTDRQGLLTLRQGRRTYVQL